MPHHVHGQDAVHGQRLTSLDAIRGIAALAVVIGHCIEETVRLLPTDGIWRQILQAIGIEYLNFGRIGVVAFFCVSGYVIPFSFAHKRPVPSFMIARFFRLYPAYWLSIAGALFLAATLGTTMPSNVQILANITMLQGALGQPHLIGVYWTLFYELVFYGMCLCAFIAGRMQSPPYLLAMIAGLCILSLIAAILRYSDVATGAPMGLFAFLAIMHLGTLARTSDRDAKPITRRYFAIGTIIILITTGPAMAIGYIQNTQNQRMLTEVTSLYAGLTLFFALRSRHDLATTPMLFLGKISYSLYLMHPLCLTALVAIAASLSTATGPLLIMLGVPLTAILLSAIVQRFVEDPSNQLGRALRRKILLA